MKNFADKFIRFFPAVMAGLIFAGFFAVHLNVFLYSDDFIYGGFLRRGFSGFWESHFDHYLTVNGRAWVHFAVSLLLFFDVWLWRFLNPAAIAAAAFFAAKIGAKSTGKNNLPLAMAAFSALLAALPVRILRESVYWLDGSLNYFFPAALVLFCFYLFLGGKRGFWVCLLFFFAAAATEQSGVMLLTLLVCQTAAGRFFRGAKPDRGAPFLLLASAAGFLTVALAPGTFARAEGEPGGGFSPARFGVVASRLLFGEGVYVSVLIFSALGVLLLLAGLNLSRKLKNRPPFFEPAALAAAFSLVAAAAASQLIFIFAPAIRERTFLPTLLFIIAAVCIFIQATAPKGPRAALFLLFSASLFFSLKITADGYGQNREANLFNLARINSIKTDPAVESVTLVMLPAEDYQHFPLYYSNLHLKYLKEYYGIADKKVYVEHPASGGVNRVFINGAQAVLNVNPPIIGNRFMLPVGEPEIAAALGYTAEWNQAELTATLTGESTVVRFTLGERVIHVDGGTLDIGMNITQYYFRNLLPAEIVGEIFGYDVLVTINEKGGFDAEFIGK